MQLILDYIQSMNINYIYIGIGILIILFVFICTFKKRKRTKEIKNIKEEYTKTTDSYVYNPLKNIQEEKIHTNFTNKNKSKPNVKKEKKIKKTRKQLKIEEEFAKEKEICVNAYNQLYGVYFKEGYSVNLQENNILAYYTSLIQNANTIEDLKNISSNISFQTIKIIEEIKFAKEKENLEKQRKLLYDQCVIKIGELSKLFKVLEISGEQTIKEFNDRLLNNGMFAKIEDYQLIYNDLIQNIEFIKYKYKTSFDKLITEESNVVDVKLIESLKLLNCSVNETNLSIIKKNYISLIKKYHPDTNYDSLASIEISSKINDAYNYILHSLK